MQIASICYNLKGARATTQAKPHTVRVPDRSYQLSRVDLREDLRLGGTSEEAIKAPVRPVKVRNVMSPKR